jgi:drug/metabolite transporter (DMT)-like permease
MNIGLLYTPVSIYQMTRGALVLFVGVLSVVFLRRRLWLYQFSLLVFFYFHDLSDEPNPDGSL